MNPAFLRAGIRSTSSVAASASASLLQGRSVVTKHVSLSRFTEWDRKVAFSSSSLVSGRLSTVSDKSFVRAYTARRGFTIRHTRNFQGQTNDMADHQREEKGKETDIVFYTDNTPNGHKIAITLEELGLKYETVHVDIKTGEQKKEWFLKINPNGRIPAIVDRTPGPDGAKREKRIFEGSAIQLYLTAKFDPTYKLSYPYDSDKYWEIVEWMTWVQSGVAPMQGQANHFYRYAPEKIEYGINRYQTETKRLYSVLEDRLKQQRESTRTAAGSDATAAGGQGDSDGEGPWIVGGKLTIADLCAWSWIYWSPWAGVSTDSFPEVKAWVQKIRSRKAVDKGLHGPLGHWDFETKMRGGEEGFSKEHSDWIMKGQNADHEKFK